MKQQRGQTLIEVIVALTIAIVIITSITYAVINSLKDSQFGKNETLATQYAQQGVEILRNMRYADYATFKGLSSGSYCMADACTAINTSTNDPCGPIGSQCTSPNVPAANSVFIRQVSIIPSAASCSGPSGGAGAGTTQVTVTVSWNDGQCPGSTNYCHQVSTTSCITNFDIIPTP